MIYFFCNVYEEEKSLMENVPENVTIVSYGWTPEEEENRNNIMNEIGISISKLPSVVAYIEEHYAHKSFFEKNIGLPNDDERVLKEYHFVPSQWVVFTIENIEKPLTWQKIFDIINNHHKL